MQHILVVDDEIGIRELLSEILSDEGYQVRLAENAADVARLGRLVVRTLQQAGLAACGKHFPGHGDTSTDSHEELPLVEHPPDRLRAVEFEPFRAAIEEDVAFIMTAHVFVPSMDEERPATLSSRIVQGLLREELGYQGVILSDDLEMKALAKDYDLAESAVLAIAAGCDGVLICRHLSSEPHNDINAQATVLEALVHAVEEERLSISRVEDALARQRKAKERFFLNGVVRRPLSAKALGQVIGREEYRAIAEEMAQFA